jgi:hypothetical protein
MTASNRALVLIAEVEKSLAVLQRIDEFYRGFCRSDPGADPRSTERAIVIADVLSSYYTCCETVFLRISQFFENSLSDDKWHQDLLRKMTLDLPGVRERVVADPTAALLGELLKFRHFKRYYFEFNYDWDRLEFLQKKYEQLQPLLRSDFSRFLLFLRGLAHGAAEP